MAQIIYVMPSGNSDPSTVPLLPALVPPGILVMDLWKILTGAQWHPLFKILGCAAFIAALIYALYLMYRFLPVGVSIALTMIYMTATYVWEALVFTSDPIWLAAIAVGGGTFGFFGGRALARDEHRMA